MRPCVRACVCVPVYANKFQNNLTFFFKLHILEHITTDFICYQKLLSATAHSGQIKHWHCHCVLSLSSFEVYTLFNVCSWFEYNFSFFSAWHGTLALCVHDTTRHGVMLSICTELLLLELCHSRLLQLVIHGGVIELHSSWASRELRWGWSLI